MPANTEKSYADRLDRARLMQSFIAGFAPAFAPLDPNLTPTAFLSYCNGCEEKNDAVSDAEASLTNITGERTTAARALQAVAGRVQDYVASNIAWKKFHKSVADASRAVRGIRTPPKPTPTAAPGEPEPTPTPARKGSRSQQGYADIAKHFAKLIKALERVTGYTATPVSGLAIASLTTQGDAYTALNAQVQGVETDLSDAQRERAGFYDGENGLKDKMKSIKMAVSGQYGRESAEHGQVKGIAL